MERLQRYELEFVSWDEAPVEMREALEPQGPDEALLGKAFERLGVVESAGAAELADVQLVLEGTIADPGQRPGALPDLGEVVLPGRPRATAAHPRAYRGTTSQPPKRGVRRIDLRPFLLSPAGLKQLERWFAEAGHSLKVPSEAWEAQPELRLAFGAHLRTRPGAKLLEASRWLRLGELRARLCAFAKLVEREGPEVACSYVASIGALDEGRGNQVLALLVTGPDLSGCPLVQAPDPRLASELALIAGCAEREQTGARKFSYACAYLLRFADSADLLERAGQGLRLVLEARGDPEEIVEPPAPLAALRAVEALALTSENGWGEFVRVRLWRACGSEPAFVEHVEALGRAGLKARAFTIWFWMLHGMLEQDPSKAASGRLRKGANELLGALARVPQPWQCKAAELLHEAYFVFELERVDRIGRLLARACCPRSGQTDVSAGVLANSLELSEPWFQAWLDLPQSSFDALDEACRRRNDAGLVDNGVLRLMRDSPAQLVEDMARHPKPVLRAARELGLLSEPQARGLLAELELPQDWRQRDLWGLIALSRSLGVPGGFNPVSGRLAKHLAGTLELTAARLDRDTARLRDGLPLLRISGIESRVLHLLQLRLLGHPNGEPEQLSRQMRHGILLQARLDRSRPALRRLLRATAAGDSKFLVQHPKNAAWAKSLPPKVRAAWFEPPVMECSVPTIGPLTIACVLDPLEALRLGTYVSSCTGLGGIFMATAAAVAMDANKHVAFARRPDGQFVARQILALTSDHRLQPMPVYPEVREALQSAFADYTRQFSAALGVELRLQDDDEAEVELLVASDWYDEGPWDLEAIEAISTT